jgi:hypothetical protein
LRLRAEYVRSRLDRPVSSFPGVSEELEDAFPDRFIRDDNDVLVAVDFRPVNYDQAKRDFINAILRRESGAVISEEEFANAEQQYFPQPGDGPEVIAQKRANRENAIRGIEVSAGQGARLATQPPSGLDAPGGLPDFSTMSDEELESLANGQ